MSNFKSDDNKSENPKLEDEIHFFFKEQWWFISALCKMSDQDWKNNLTHNEFESNKTDDVYSVNQMDSQINEKMNQIVDPNRFSQFVRNPKDRDRIVKICQSLHWESRWHDYIKDYEFYDFEVKKIIHYRSLGFFGFRVRLKLDASVNVEEITPNDMQQIVFAFYDEFKKLYGQEFQFDDESSPYIFSISDRYKTTLSEEKLIEWSKKRIDQYKRGIGIWVELYSGQYEDYNDELYTYRTDINFSNRLSELHFIMRNSAFIYMNPENYGLFFVKENKDSTSSGYMYKSVVISVVQIRTLLFGILQLNRVIDEDTKRLASRIEMEYDPEKIKFDLDYTLRLKNTLQSVISPVFTDLNKNHRQHYARIMNHALSIFQISYNWSLIQHKIDSNMQALENIYLDKQREMQKKQANEQEKLIAIQQATQQRQQNMMTLLQLILGTGVIFDILVDVIDSRAELRAAVMITMAIIAIFAIQITKKTYRSNLEKYKKVLYIIGIFQWALVFWIIFYFIYQISTLGFVFNKELEWVLLGMGLIILGYMWSIRNKKLLEPECEQKEVINK